MKSCSLFPSQKLFFGVSWPCHATEVLKIFFFKCSRRSSVQLHSYAGGHKNGSSGCFFSFRGNHFCRQTLDVSTEIVSSRLGLWVCAFVWLINLNFEGPASLPLIGDILTIKRLLTELKSYHLVWQHFSKLHGSIVGLKMIKDYVIVVSGIENIKKFSALPELDGRPNGFFFRIRSFGKRLGIVFTDGLFWEEQRNFSVKALKLLGLGKLSMVEHIEREAKELVIALQKGEKNVVVVQGEDTNLFDISVMNVMWTIMRGKRFELHDECLVNLMEMVHKNFKIIDMSGGLLSQLPWIRFVAPTLSGYRTTVETMKPLWQFLDENIQQIFSNYDVHDEPSNFIESYCREMHNQPNVSTFSREQLLALCIDFFQAGSETTSNTLTFGLLYMLHYPHVMKQIQKELDEVVGSRFPALSDRKNLKYVQATLAEIQRMASVAPVGRITWLSSSFDQIHRFLLFRRNCTSNAIWGARWSLHDSKGCNRSVQCLRTQHGREVLEASECLQSRKIPQQWWRFDKPREFHSVWLGNAQMHRRKLS